MNEGSPDVGGRGEDDRARESLNLILGKHGWRFFGSRPVAPAVIEYEVERISDGKRLCHRMTVAEICTNPLDEVFQTLPKELRPPVSAHLAVQLLLLVKREGNSPR